MSKDQTETQLVTSAMKMQTLLHQFIQLYDRLTVEHSLMADRELKIIKNLGNLTETINQLEQTITGLRALEQQLQVNVQKLIREEVNNNFVGIANSIVTHMEQQVIPICSSLNSAHTKMQYMVNEYETICQTFSFKVMVMVLLLGLVLGLGAGFLRDWSIRKENLLYWNNLEAKGMSKKK